MSETGFQVEERDGEIFVMCADLLFIATYTRANEYQLALRRRTPTNDHALLARAFQAAIAKARELGWIV